MGCEMVGRGRLLSMFINECRRKGAKDETGVLQLFEEYELLKDAPFPFDGSSTRLWRDEQRDNLADGASRSGRFFFACPPRLLGPLTASLCPEARVRPYVPVAGADSRVGQYGTDLLLHFLFQGPSDVKVPVYKFWCAAGRLCARVVKRHSVRAYIVLVRFLSFSIGRAGYDDTSQGSPQLPDFVNAGLAFVDKITQCGLLDTDANFHFSTRRRRAAEAPAADAGVVRECVRGAAPEPVGAADGGAMLVRVGASHLRFEPWRSALEQPLAGRCARPAPSRRVA